MAIEVIASLESGDGDSPGEHALDRLAVDGLTLAARGVTHGVVRDAVDVAQRTGGVLVHQVEGVDREEVLLCSFVITTSSV